MRQGYFRVGQDLILSDVNYRIVRIQENNTCHLERAKDLALISRSKNELLASLVDGSLCFSGSESAANETPAAHRCEPDILSLPIAQQRQVMRRHAYVQQAERVLGEKPSTQNLDIVIATVAQRLDDTNKPAPITVYRWWRRWLGSGRSLNSLGKKPRANHVQRRFSGVVLEEVHKVIDEIYLVREKNTHQDAYDLLRHRLLILNSARTFPLSIPSRATFYRIRSTYDNYSVMSAKKGKAAANRHFRSTERGVDTQYILERCEMDHTPLDLIVVDDAGRALGRPNVTFLIDRHSRMPMGFEVGFEPPSELSVMAALRNAILPKIYLQSDYPEIESDWPAYGIPTALVCDNGLEFHSQQLRHMCRELNIELIFCPKKQPQYKGAIERFLGTFNRQVSHRVPGTTFSNIIERGDYNPVENARITLKDVKKLIHLWITDIYNKSINRISKKSPYVSWNQGLALIEPRVPQSTEQLELVMAYEKICTLSHSGVQFQGLIYNSFELAALRIRNNGDAKVPVRINSENLSTVWVFDSYDNGYIRTPCLHQEYAANLSLHQHTIIRKQQRLSNAALVDEAELLRAKAKFFLQIQEMSSSTKLKERKKSARLQINRSANQSSMSSLDAERCIDSSDGFEDSASPYDDIEIPNFDLMVHDGVLS